MRARRSVAAACLAALVVLTGGCNSAGAGGANEAGNADGRADTRRAACGTVSELLVPSCGAWLGMWPRTGADGVRTGDLQANLASLEQRADRRFDIVSRYYGWGEELPDASDAAWRDSGRMVLLDLRARHLVTGAQVTWTEIAQGRHDAYLTRIAGKVKDFGAKVFFSFNHEPEIELEKGTAVAGTAADYTAAYRHIHDLFAKAGATNVVWVWWVMGFMGHVAWYPALYPGDRYVDWVSYDPYDFNTCRNAAAETPQQTIMPFLDWLNNSGIAEGKPVMLSEFGSHGGGADRGEWYRGVGDLIKQTPRIKAIIPFNSQPRDGTCDFRLAASPQKWAGFQSMAADPYFNQTLPR
jgi:hypothetical protein